MINKSVVYCSISMVLKLKSRYKTKTGYFLRTNDVYEMIINTKKSSFSGVMFTVRRLVSVEKIVRRKVFSKTRFDNKFDDFGYDR